MDHHTRYIDAKQSKWSLWIQSSLTFIRQTAVHFFWNDFNDRVVVVYEKLWTKQQSVSLHVQVLCVVWNSETETCHKHSREQAPKGSGQAYFSVISISVSTDGILCPCSMTLTSSIFLDGKVKVEKSFSHNCVILRTILRYWFYCIKNLKQFFPSLYSNRYS